VGFFRSVVNTNRLLLAANFYVRLPSFLASRYTEKAMATMRHGVALVLTVCSAVSLSKIPKSVVAWVPVYVVNLVSRPHTIRVKPSEPVLKTEVGFVNRDTAISARVLIPGSGACGPAMGCHLEPEKLPSNWVVAKNFAYAFCRKIAISHDALLKLIGQRPATVSSGAPGFIIV
jgi:hypothetical protein